jgi:hypothetical protein
MTDAIDPVTSALTGHLSFHLLLAGILTWPIAIGLLRLYTRAVRRSMSSRSHALGDTVARAGVPLPSSLARHIGAPPTSLTDLRAPPVPADAADEDELWARVVHGPRRAAIIYALAGCAYALVMAAAQLRADGTEFLPVRFMFLAWMFAWPIVPTIGMVGAPTRGFKLGVLAAYLTGVALLGAVGIARNPALTWAQVVSVWALYNLPATLLLVTYLSRRIRAVGPLVLTFLVLALIGSDVALSIAGNSDDVLRAVIVVADRLGLGRYGAFITMLVTGFVVFGLFGTAALLWIGRRYQAKRISDESLSVDALWVLFAIVHSMNLVFGHPRWTLAALAAFVVYKLVVRAGFAWSAARTTSPRRPTLLALRSFSIGADSERLFDAIGRYWRRAGSIQMIAGVDFANSTIEPHEFLDFMSGRLSRRFIDSAEGLERRMAERDMAPDRDQRFRVNEFFCYDDTWKMVLTRLVQESDAVLMDLRGFSRQNAGCVFELGELSALVPLDRVVFVIDGRTDETFLAETLGSERRASMLRLHDVNSRQFSLLLRAVTAAAVRGSAGHAAAVHV